ncbi:MAG: TauD/TfdA family dioxygenase [Bacteriovoracaceae bacterium]|nr:TauD/TfdA family dioxygenase [Bacteriovoracaceae bacterium]
MTKPYIITPSSEISADQLAEYLKNHEAEVQTLLQKEGAILFRGFKIETPKEFQTLAKVYSPNLAADYYGTSPRTKIEEADEVFTASEIPAFFPMLQHCEMSFLKNNPNLIYFYCQQPPRKGGETPICDFREVYRQMKPEIREKFETKKLKTIRQYHKVRKGLYNPFELKPWSEMFATTKRDEIEDICKKIDLQVEWGENEQLKLITYNEAFLKHPKTDDIIWHNHAQVFHETSTVFECHRVLKRQRSLMSFATYLLSLIFLAARKFRKNAFVPMDVTFGDGTPIPGHYIKHVHDLIWKNQIIFKWEKGDFLMLDNKRTSHGRLPYQGPRSILVAWE